MAMRRCVIRSLGRPLRWCVAELASRDVLKPASWPECRLYTQPYCAQQSTSGKLRFMLP